MTASDAQRPIQPQGAASPQGAMLDAENAKPLASSGPDGQSEAALAADLPALLLQAVEALENYISEDETAEGYGAGIGGQVRENARSVAAALRQRLGRE